MKSVYLRLVGALAITAVAASACSTAATPSSGGGGAGNSAAASLVATVPADQLIKAGTLTVCSDTSYPPQESLDASNNAVGSDIDLAKEIAKRLGLQLAVKSTVFDTIIPALQGGSCDIIVSAQTITAERQKAVDMIPYFAAGQSFVVLKGNPSNIKAVTDLCGQKVAAEKGTVEADNLGGTGDYKGAGIAKTCTDAGKQPPTVQVFDADTAALQALQAGTVVAHFTDEPVAGYEVEKGGGKFEMVPSLTLEHAPEGISVLKTKTAVRDAVKTALLSIMNDGTYTKILTQWGVQSGAIQPADVNATPAPAAS